MAKSWGNTKAPSSSNRTNIDDLVDIYKFGPDFSAIRFIGPVTSVATHWFDILNKEGEKVSIGKVCLNYNPTTEEFDANSCPYCEGDIRVANRYFANAIIREFQESEPRKKYPPIASEQKIVNLGDKTEPFKARIKDKKSKTWTPVRIISLPPTLTSQLIDLSQTNRHVVSDGKSKREESFPVSHPRYGCDLEVNFKKGGQYGYGKYDVQKGPNTPITKDERRYLLWTLDLRVGLETLKEATENMKSLSSKIIERDGSDDSDAPISKRRRKSGVDDDPYDKDDDSDYIEKETRTKRRRKREEPENEFDELDRSLTRRKKRKRPVEGDDDAPRRKKRRPAGSSPSRSKRSRR